MPKKKVTEVTQADLDAASPKSSEKRLVLYTIMVTGLTDRIKIEHARNALHARQVPIGRMIIDAEAGVLTVSRLQTFWQGDEIESAWQRSIKDAVPNCLIDVADWTHAPGYPKGEIGVATDE